MTTNNNNHRQQQRTTTKTNNKEKRKEDISRKLKRKHWKAEQPRRESGETEKKKEVTLIPFSCFQYMLFMCSCFYTVSSCAYTHIIRIHFERILTSGLILRHKLMLTHIWHTYRNSHTQSNSMYSSKSQSNTNTQQNSTLNPNPKTHKSITNRNQTKRKELSALAEKPKKREREGFEWRENQWERV